MRIGYLYLKIQIPGCKSLKDKRSRIKPILARVRKEFNVASAELDLHDIWQTTAIGLVTVSTDTVRAERILQSIPGWIEQCWPDLLIEVEKIELL